MIDLEVPHAGHIEPTALINPDLEPMPEHRRKWGFYSFFGYWAVPNITIWTWSTGSALVGLGSGTGLTLAHAMGALTVGNFIICAYTCWNSGPGSKYHIGYTVTQRMIFGIYGSGVGVLVRVVLSIVFYGSQSWLGGLAVVVIFLSLSDRFLNLPNTFWSNIHMTTRDFIGFLVFQVVQMVFYVLRPEQMNKWVNALCVATGAAFVAVVAVVLSQNGGGGPEFHRELTMPRAAAAWAWLRAMTIWYGALSPNVTNQSDYARFASGARKMHWGICTAVLTSGTLVPLAGMACASATGSLYGEAMWLPTDIVLRWLHDNYSAGARAGGFFLGLAFASSQLSFNVVANGFAGGMDLAAVWPRYINIRRGAIFTALVSWAVQPWNFYNSSLVFINVMSSFGVIVTPIVGIMVADFHIVRRRVVPVEDLYTTAPSGAFYFCHGFNWRALVVLAAVVAPGIPGLIDCGRSTHIPRGFRHFFDGNIVFAFVAALGAYVAVCWVFPPEIPPKEPPSLKLKKTTSHRDPVTQDV